MHTGAMKKGKRRLAEIFISHADDDRDLALQLKYLFQTVFSVGVFCTSDVRAMEGGRAWFTQIMNALDGARVCVALLTPASIHRVWLMFESGGAFALGWGQEARLRMLPALAGGLRPSGLPGPFGLIQARELKTASGVRALCGDIAGVLDARLSRPPRGLLSAICTCAGKGSRHWGSVSQTLAGQRTDESPFSLDSLLENAKKSVFCAGQNLNYLATSAAMRRRITRWVKRDPKRRVELLICDPAETNAVDGWSVVGPKYREDLNQSVLIFRKWKRTLKNSAAGKRVDIRVTKLVTTTLTVIDPSHDRSLMIVTPIVFGKPISAERPHFAISRATNRGVFNHYWETYRDVFHRAKRL